MSATPGRGLAAGSAYAPAELVPGAPHLRSALNVPLVMRCVLLATTPCLGVALYNTGYQANRALSAGARPLEGWRQGALSLLGPMPSPDAPLHCLLHGALVLLPLLAAVYLAGRLSEDLFARFRGRAPDRVALPVIAVLFTLCLPPTLSLWQAAVGAAVGIVVGKEIFGGFGRNFVNPALVGLAFLYFAYPGSVTGDQVWVGVDGFSAATPLVSAGRGGLEALAAAGLDWRDAALGWVPGPLGATSPLAALLGLVVLLYTGVASVRIVLGGLLGFAAGLGLAQLLDPALPIAELPWHWHLVSGGFAFGIVFLATDPVTAAVTNPGRWIYGALIGAFVVLIRIANPAHNEGVLLALLLGNVSAPLIDQLVARAMMRRRGIARAH